MPISKNSKILLCPNDNSTLVLEKQNQRDGFIGYALSSVYKREKGVTIDTGIVYLVSIYKCPICGYLELYDKG